MLTVLFLITTGLVPSLPSDLLFQNSPHPVLSGQSAMSILQRAYPNQVTTYGETGGDWWIQVGGKKYSWSQGRMLPWELRSQWEDWDSQSFYAYPPQEIDPSTWPENLISAAETAFTRRWDSEVKRHPGFFDSLWGINSRRTAEAKMVQIRFQGFRLKVHRLLVPILQRLNSRVTTLRAQDREVNEYFRTLRTIDGYNWRPIAGTTSRSLHSYGVALDFTPKNYRGKTAYWRWSYDAENPWFLDAWNNRHLPPAGLVSLFEEAGFTWGGRWFLFDTMHFEYRPDLFFLK